MQNAEKEKIDLTRKTEENRPDPEDDPEETPKTKTFLALIVKKIHPNKVLLDHFHTLHT